MRVPLRSAVLVLMALLLSPSPVRAHGDVAAAHDGDAHRQPPAFAD